TAIGMAQDLMIMIAAVVIACLIMYVSSGPIAKFVSEHPTTKMLALAFLVLIGVALVADGFQFHIPRGYIYFAITFSAAVEFFNVYYRTGLYKAPGLPFIAGNEAAGEVVAVGPGVTNFHPGDRVAYYHNLGAYAGERNIPWEKLVKLPDHITYEQGAVLMLKG